VTFFDDNPYGASSKIGELHNKNKVNCFIMFETYKTKYVTSDRGTYGKNGDFQNLAETINETPASRRETGYLSWTMPISVKEIPGHRIEVENFGPNYGRKRVGYQIILPIEGIERYLHDNFPDFEKMPIHFASYANIHTEDNELMMRNPKYLRYTVAISDSSGNFLIPSSSVVSDSAVIDRLISIYSSMNGGSNLPTINKHSYFGKIFVLDNIKPVPICVMTNTRTKKTTIFTMDIGDLSSNPYGDSLNEWIFTYTGSSSAMEKLTPSKRKEFKESLVVAEGDRLVFQILGYDNISKDYISSDGSGNHGISTPIVGDSPEFYRYQTFEIKDPTAGSQDSLIERKVGGVKIFVYPDYMFRGSSSKEQSVSFYITDYSIFRDKNSALSGNFDVNSSFLSRVNRRALKLVFKVVKSNFSTERMSTTDELKKK